LKKLVKAGIIEKKKEFFWSKKGKKIEMYKVANKLIVIAPKKSNVYSKLKGIVPVALISGILTLFIAWYTKARGFVTRDAVIKAGENVIAPAVEEEVSAGSSAVSSVSQKVAESVGNIIPETTQIFSYPAIWLWFLLGSLIAILAFLIWHWKKL